jgi:hypothetical protein
MLRTYKRGRWMYALELEAEEWMGCYADLEVALGQAAEFLHYMELDPSTPIYLAHGSPMRKRECEERGMEWPYYEIDRDDAIRVVLPNGKGPVV